MKAVRLVALAIFVFCATLLLLSRYAEAAPPPDPAQQRPDIFPCTGCDMQLLNPVTVKSKAVRVVNYRLLTMPGCSTGTVPIDMVRVEQQAQLVNFTLNRNDTAYDMTVRINCGSEQIRYCGAVTTFCLGRGFPYNPDVEISDIISTYYPDSRMAILLHEIMGHAVGSWNEQYALCGASCGFAATPGFRDFMNTGPDSRHGFESSELGRWERVMYPLTVECVDNPCWDGARWVFNDGNAYEPATGDWWLNGKREWSACNKDFLRWNYQLQVWAPPKTTIYEPVRGYWSSAGAC